MASPRCGPPAGEITVLPVGRIKSHPGCFQVPLVGHGVNRDGLPHAVLAGVALEVRLVDNHARGEEADDQQEVKEHDKGRRYAHAKRVSLLPKM